jgi:hypothetical protein
VSGAPAERKRAIDGLLRKAWRLTEPAAGKQVGCGRLLSVSVDCRRDGGGALLTVLVGGAASTLKESTRLHRPLRRAPHACAPDLRAFMCASRKSCAQAHAAFRTGRRRRVLARLMCNLYSSVDPDLPGPASPCLDAGGLSSAPCGSTEPHTCAPSCTQARAARARVTGRKRVNECVRDRVQARAVRACVTGRKRLSAFVRTRVQALERVRA